MYKIKRYIEQHGKEYIPTVAPKYMERGKVGECFDASLLAAYKYNLKYVEGLAYNPINKRWILHAWVSDGKHAFDLTWRAYKDGVEVPMPTKYYGVELDKYLVAEFIKKVGYNCILKSGYRNKTIAQKILCH